MTSPALALVRSSMATHGKSFALAARALPAGLGDDTAAVYAFCRRADDRVDESPQREQHAAVQGLERELAAIYAGDAQSDAVLAAFQQVVRRRGIPRHYPEELLQGMRMDALGTVYATVPELLRYCYRVASTVGLMMCHVFGVSDARALRHAAHLGIAMQLTNVCRDVQEDWARGRLYIPADLLDGPIRHDHPLAAQRAAIASAVRELLSRADAYYASGERGVRYLPLRSAIAVRIARFVYADIGRVILARGADPLAPRAIVSRARKATLVVAAVVRTLCESRPRFRRASLDAVLWGSDVVSL